MHSGLKCLVKSCNKLPMHVKDIPNVVMLEVCDEHYEVAEGAMTIAHERVLTLRSDYERDLRVIGQGVIKHVRNYVP